MLHSYQPKDASACLSSRRVVFIGDSIARKLFFQFGQVLDPALPKGPPSDEQKHSDHALHSKAGTQLEFYWDPYLNTSLTREFINLPTKTGNATEILSRKPSLLILGSGLWYL